MDVNELYHHGINGQKWGVRNGPPYPLGASDHSASEKKAGWRKSLDKPSRTTHTKSSYEKESADEKKHGLTDKQKSRIKKVVIAAGAMTVVAAAAYVAHNKYCKE